MLRIRFLEKFAYDILASETSRIGSSINQVKVKNLVKVLIDKHC